uniref:ULP_PROTEASE domain-containing protein n=1 Tax=Macrostomum lignano TaxID=282301 RepID=A0A1I8FIH0_9PLAT
TSSRPTRSQPGHRSRTPPPKRLRRCTAVRRALRHEESRRQLPAWLQHSVTVAKTFESVPDRLREFFASNSVKYPTPDGPKMRLPAKQQQMQFDGQSAGRAPARSTAAQCRPLIGGGRAGTVIEFLHSYEKSPALDELANLRNGAEFGPDALEGAPPGVEEGAAGRSKHVAFQTESAAESQADAAVKQDGDFKVPLAAPPNFSATLANLRSVAKSSLSPSPSPSATPKPTPASPSNPFSTISAFAISAFAGMCPNFGLTLQQALGQERTVQIPVGPGRVPNPRGGVDRLLWPAGRGFPSPPLGSPRQVVARASGRRTAAAFGLGRLIRTPDRARYEQVPEEDDDLDGAALRPPAKRLKTRRVLPPPASFDALVKLRCARRPASAAYRHRSCMPSRGLPGTAGFTDASGTRAKCDYIMLRHGCWPL